MKRLSSAFAVSVIAATLAAIAMPATAGKHVAAADQAKVNPALEAAVANPLRDKDRARDQYRNPAQTLAFFQIEPGMKVGEYAPGGGWYSRLLGLYLGEKGQFVGLFYDPAAGPFNEKTQQGIRDGVAKFPAEVAAWSNLPPERFRAFSLGNVPEGEKGTFDRILIMRMMHNLLRWNIADHEIKIMRDLLKPGGMIGIEQHRARPDAPYSYTDGSKGYLREADVIRFMELHGFEFVGSSEANANPRDPANHPGGVWTLPPSLSGAKDDAEKARLNAIGESDRMTLLFRKRP